MLTEFEFMRPYHDRVKLVKVKGDRVVSRGDDGKPFTWYEEKEVMTTDDFNMLCNAYEEWLEIEKLQTQAKNELYKIEVKQEIKKSKHTQYTEKNIALTICPPPDYATIEHIQKIADIVCKCSAYLKILYVFEQRSIEDEEEHGWHLHMSITTTYSKSKVLQFAKQRLDSRGYVFTSKHAYEVADEFNDDFREKYMKGIKNHVDKDPKVKKDIILRAKYNLQDYYMVEKNNVN